MEAASACAWWRLLAALRVTASESQAVIDLEARIAGTSAALSLEKFVNKRSRFHDAALLDARLGSLLGGICEVEDEGAGHGTGWLVGADLVLTNEDVVAGVEPTGLRCSFEFKCIDGVTSRGRAVPCSTGAGWCVASRRHSPADTTVSVTTGWQPQELDYAQ